MMKSVHYEPVERRRGLSLVEFKKKYFNRSPVIVEDAMDDWEARPLWSFDGFKSRFGKDTVLAYGYQQGNYQQEMIQPMRLADYIDKIIANDFDAYPYYLRDNYTMFVDHKELWDEFRSPKYCFDWFKLLPSFVLRPGPRIFMGPKGAVTNLHQDMWGTHFWLAQLAGRKHWVLFSPDQYKFLYNYCWEIRPGEPDLKRYPKYEKVKGIECVLRPGELIIVPRGWVHWVHSLDPTISLTHNYMGPGNFCSCLTGQVRWTIAATMAAMKVRFRGSEATPLRS